MGKNTQVKIPNIGDFEGVEVIEVLVAPGDEVAAEASLVTLESDKASMEIPSPEAGRVASVDLQVGDKVSEGDTILTLETSAGETTGTEAQQDTGNGGGAPAKEKSAPAPARPAADADIHAEVLVLGAGPGGYTAAFRAADLGKQVVLVERYPDLGGVCLNVGCIPSKALLHTAGIIDAAAAMASHGVSFGQPEIDLDRLRGWKDKVVGKLTGGLAQLAKQRKVQVVHGSGRFDSANRLKVEDGDGERTISFDHAIVAAGSRVTRIPGIPYDDPRVMDSTGALELADIPDSLLVIGGGIIGLEMATVYAALGSRITVVELTKGLMPGCDRDLVRPLQKIIGKRYENIYTDTKVTGVEAQKKGLKVHFDGPKAPATATFDRVLVAAGRRPNGDRVGAEQAHLYVDERGFIKVDRQMRTNVSNIFAIGDVVGQPMLAHKATHEAKVAAEVIAGQRTVFDARTVPSVAYTDPEVAWMGPTEEELKAEGIDYEKGVFPWAASGRSLGMGRDEGVTKVMFDRESGRILGAGMVGPHAGDLVAEAVLALEMGADAQDIGLSVHPHPTLSETFAFAAEMVDGSITDLLPPRKR